MTGTSQRLTVPLDWAEVETLYLELLGRRINAASLDTFMRDWTLATDNVTEMNKASLIATTKDSYDDRARLLRHSFLLEIVPTADDYEQRLKERLLDSKLAPAGFDQIMRRMHADVDLYQRNNATAVSFDAELCQEYERLTAARTVTWNGQDIPLPELQAMFVSPDRATRTAAWKVASERCLRDRDAINEIWRRCILNRCEIARNAGLTSWLKYRWRQLHRFDYEPEDIRQLHRCIETNVVPLLRERHNTRSRRLEILRSCVHGISEPICMIPTRRFHSIPWMTSWALAPTFWIMPTGNSVA